MPPRALLPLAAAAAAVLLAACAGDNPPPPLSQATSPPAGSVELAPRVFVLRPDQLRDYHSAGQSMVSSGTFADQEQDPGLASRLDSQGLIDGARATYDDPPRSSPPFRQIISEALIFKDAAGAARFFADEQQRRSAPPSGGAVRPLAGVPDTGVDEVVALDATLPADTSNPQGVKAFLLLARHGRVVAEMLGGGDPATATVDRFDDLVRLQEGLLASGPTV